MTISYTSYVTSSSSFGLIKILFRWKGSIWRGVYKELIVFLLLFYVVNSIYMYAFKVRHRRTFNEVVKVLDKEKDLIPLQFLLGFFVGEVIKRWNDFSKNLGWIDDLALAIASTIKGHDDESVITRRTMIRYAVLSQILVLRNLSVNVRRRFPTWDAIVRSGFITIEERDQLNAIQIPYNKYAIPFNWILSLANRKSEKEEIAATTMNAFANSICKFREHLHSLESTDWIPIPLSYPQLVFVAVRMYFVLCLFTRQCLLHENEHSHGILIKGVFCFPLMTILQFICLLGWMKVAEALLNPLGDDDDDLEANFIIDQNLAVGMALVDTTFDRVSNLKRDKFNDMYFMRPSKWHRGQECIKGSASGLELKDDNDGSSMMIDDYHPILRHPTALEIETLNRFDQQNQMMANGHATMYNRDSRRLIPVTLF